MANSRDLSFLPDLTQHLQTPMEKPQKQKLPSICKNMKCPELAYKTSESFLIHNIGTPMHEQVFTTSSK